MLLRSLFVGQRAWRFYTALPDVPIYTTSISEVTRQFFPKPQDSFPDQLVFGVILDLSSPDMPSIRGRLKLVSPPEMLGTAVLNVAKDINDGADDDVLKMHLNMFLSCTTEYLLLKTEDDYYFKSLDHRERLGSKYAAHPPTLD